MNDKKIAFLVISFLIAGCSTLPKLSTPTTKDIVAANAFRGASEQGSQFNETWWNSFNDPLLSNLIDIATKSNLDLRMAVLKVEEARVGITANESRLMPSVNIESTVSDSRSGLPKPYKTGAPDVRATRANLNMAWEIDLFGAAKETVNASKFEAKTASYGLDAVRLIITSEVAKNYFVWKDARARLRLLKKFLETQSETERVVSNLVKNGQASAFDLSRASAETRKVSAQIPALEMLISISENRIAVLLSESPIEVLPLLQNPPAPELTEAPSMPIGQPIELLERRPDLKVAEMKFLAAQSRLKEKHANQLPKFFLSALIGRQGLTINSTSLSSVMYSNVALAFTMPIFNAGRLQAEVDAQSAIEKSAALNYQKSVLTAVEDVENALVALSEKRAQLSEQLEVKNQLEKSLYHAKSLYREGQIGLIPLLDVQRGLIAAELSIAESRSQTLLSSVQLYKAMGGGWITERSLAESNSAKTKKTDVN